MFKVLITFMIAVTIVAVTVIGGWVIYRMRLNAGDKYADWSEGTLTMVGAEIIIGVLMLLILAIIW